MELQTIEVYGIEGSYCHSDQPLPASIILEDIKMDGDIDAQIAERLREQGINAVSWQWEEAHGNSGLAEKKLEAIEAALEKYDHDPGYTASFLLTDLRAALAMQS